MFQYTLKCTQGEDQFEKESKFHYLEQFHSCNLIGSKAIVSADDFVLREIDSFEVMMHESEFPFRPTKNKKIWKSRLKLNRYFTSSTINNDERNTLYFFILLLLIT